MADANIQQRPYRIKDISGSIFKRLTVRSFSHVANKKTYWNCDCTCGNQVVLPKAALIGKSTKSCGCLVLDTITKHGQARDGNNSPEYRAWAHAKERCTNPNTRGYSNYGGRGITMCDEWRDSFENFFRDVGPRPSPRHSIDRYPNNDGNYEPGNVRWATMKEQCRNARKNRTITANGETLTIAEWAERTGIHPETIRGRLDSNWSHHDIVFKPLQRK